MMRFINNIKRRLKQSRWPLLLSLPKGGVGVEIGVWKGEFSEKLAKVTKPACLHLVDPWAFQKEYPRRFYGGKIAQSQADMDEVMRGVEKKLSGKPVKFWRMYSDEFFKSFDGQADWVYIDGNHLYDFVLSDLEGALKILKPDGIICGDDFDWTDEGRLHVQDAVEAFCKKHGFTYRILGTQFTISPASKSPQSVPAQRDVA